MSNNIYYFTANWCGPCKSIVGDIQKLNEQYTDINFYKIDNVDFFVKSERQNLPNNYTTAELSNSNKINEGLGLSESFSSIILNNNPFDLRLIYNKRTGFSESFGFSVRLVKK